jgi:hypothetical protein
MTMRTIILNNWKTSLIGILLMAAGLYTGLTAKQSWIESGPIILSGAGLIFSKDADNAPEIIKEGLQNHIQHD